MSVASINNGTLQLSDLIISNEKYSNSAGYLASTATFSAGLTGTSIFVPEITATTITIGESPDIATLSFVDGTGLNCDQGFGAINVKIGESPDVVTLQCTADGVLSVPSLAVGGNATVANSLTVGPNIVGGTDYSYISATNINIVNSSNLEESVDLKCTGLNEMNVQSILLGTTDPDTSVLLQCTTSNELSVPDLAVGGNATITNSLVVGPNIVGGTDYSYISASSYTGGLGRFQGSLDFGTIGPGAKYFFPEVTLSNFVGTATSSYVISSNYTDSGVINPLIWSVEFVSADTETTSTIVSVEVYNTLTSNSILGPNNVSIIAMN